MTYSRNFESLWIDDNQNQFKLRKSAKLFSKLIKNERFTTNKKISKLLQQFEVAKNSGSFSNEPGRKLISNPVEFKHVAHLDKNSVSGMENTFDSNYSPISLNRGTTDENQREDGYAHENSLNIHRSISPSDIEVKYESTLDPNPKISKSVHSSNCKIQAYSSYRTSPTPLDSQQILPTMNRNIIVSHNRSTSVASSNVGNILRRSSSTFTKNSGRMSLSSVSSYGSGFEIKRDSIKKPINLPCIPQEDPAETEIEIYDLNSKFLNMPCAPPPPLSINVEEKEEEEEEEEEEEDDEDDDAELVLEKLELSNYVSDLTTQLEESLKLNDIEQIKKVSRNSMILLFKAEKEDQTQLLDLLEKSQICLKNALSSVSDPKTEDEELEVELESDDDFVSFMENDEIENINTFVDFFGDLGLDNSLLDGEHELLDILEC